MPSRSRSPDDGRWVTGKILIENLPKRAISHEDVSNWLKKYGNISVVQFDSDLEAAGAVQCEDGAHFFGSAVSVKHIEPNDAKMLRRMGPPVDRFTSDFGRNSSRYRERGYERDKTYERDRERYHSRDRNYDYDRDCDRDHERSRDRDRERDQDFDRNRRSTTGDQDFDRNRRSTTRDRHRTREDSYESRRKRDDPSPRRHSRSPLLDRPDRRTVVHPVNWLSEVTKTDKPLLPETIDSTAPKSPPYTAAIIATQHDLVPYAEIIEQRITAILKRHELPPSTSLASTRTHIVVLLSMDHLTPCLADLTKDNVPFAIICTTTNWTHGSCTLRILYAPTQQEHRNMPLEDAMTLLTKEYETYISSVVSPTTNPIVTKSTPAPNSNHPTPAVAGVLNNTPAPNNFTSQILAQRSVDPISMEDTNFPAPTRHISTLLRMLADSRILSIGELDEIASFVQQCKIRLQGRRRESNTGGENTAELKSRILSMLYPTTSTSGAGNPLSNAPQPVPPPQQSQQAQSLRNSLPATLGSKLAENLANPVIQQAIDNILSYPSNTLSQPPLFANYGAPGLLGDRLNPHSNSGPGNVPLLKPNQRYGAKSDVLNMRTGKIDSPSSKNHNQISQMSQNLQIWNPNDPHFDGSNKSQNYRNQNYPESGKLPTEHVNDANKRDNHHYMTSSNQTRNRTTYEHTNSAESMDNSGWQRRKRGRRGGGGGAGPKRAHSPAVSTPAGATQQPPNLMSTEVSPVGTIAKAYNYGADPFNSTVPPQPPHLVYSNNARYYSNNQSASGGLGAGTYSYPPPSASVGSHNPAYNFPNHQYY